MPEDYTFSDEGNQMDLSSGKGMEYRQLLLWHSNRILTIGSKASSVDSDYISQKISLTQTYMEAVKDFEAVTAPYHDKKFAKDLLAEMARYMAEIKMVKKNDFDKQLDSKKEHYRNRYSNVMILLGRRSLLIELSGAGHYAEV